MFRFIFLILLCTACSTNASSPAESEEKTEATTMKQLDSQQQVAELLIKNISRTVVISADQQEQIKAVAAEYDIAALNSDNSQRAQLREKISTQVLTPEQAKAWKEALQKSKRSVIIE